MADEVATTAGVPSGAGALAVVTVLSRVAGFARGLVFVRAVGATDVGDTYTRANTVPNIVFETVAGGALASSVVPLLAGPAERSATDETSATTSALLTWSVLVLLPMSLFGIVLSRPLMQLLTPVHVGGDRARAIAVGARMLEVFAPQVVLYGIGVVLTGVLQAHRRFLGPALAPLMSSVVVAASYLWYFVETRSHAPSLATVTRGEELTLAVGTTLGVAVLSLSLLVPLRGTGVQLQPRLRFPDGVARRALRLAVAGVATLAAQQLSLVVVLRLSYGGPAGTLVLYQLAWTVFLLPWAVLAVPLATSAFPRLVIHHERDDGGYATLAAMTTRTVLLVSGCAAAVFVAAADPIARVLVLHARGVGTSATLASAVTAFAPGLLGYGLVAHAGRALYAAGRGRQAAVATVLGWIAVVAGDLALAALAARAHRLEALAWGNTVGMTVAGIALLVAMSRHRPDSVDGTLRTLTLTLVAAAIAAPTGWLLSHFWRHGGIATALLTAVLVALWTMGVFALLARLLDPEPVRALLAAGRRRG